MRQRNEPHVDWKSLYLVFGLQALLALLVVLPFLAAAAAPGPATTWSGLQGLGLAVALSNLLSHFVSQRLRYPREGRIFSKIVQTTYSFSRHQATPHFLVWLTIDNYLLPTTKDPRQLQNSIQIYWTSGETDEFRTLRFFNTNLHSRCSSKTATGPKPAIRQISVNARSRCIAVVQNKESKARLREKEALS